MCAHEGNGHSKVVIADSSGNPAGPESQPNGNGVNGHEGQADGVISLSRRAHFSRVFGSASRPAREKGRWDRKTGGIEDFIRRGLDEGRKLLDQMPGNLGFLTDWCA